MPKLRSPLLSLEARKKLGRTIVFQQHKRRARAISYASPPPSRTTAQGTRRDLYSDCVTAYNQMVDSQHVQYANLGPRRGLKNAYQNFMGVCLMTDILATEATLAELKDRIGDEVDPDAGTVNKHLADILADSLLNLKTADLLIQPSKELVVLNTSLVGAVETPNVAFAGGVQKTALGLWHLDKATRTGVLETGADWTTVLSTSVTGVLEWLEFSSNYGASNIKITGDGDVLYSASRTGNITWDLTPDAVDHVGGETAIWKAGIYDAVNNYYTLFLKRPIQYNYSLVVQCRQQSGVNKNICILAYYRNIS